MAKPLWQDSRYVKDVEWAIEMMDRWREANPKNKHRFKAIRMKYALIAQPDKAFQPMIRRAIETNQPMQDFVRSLKGVEDRLIKTSKLISPEGVGNIVHRGIKGGYQEGHHGMATGTLSKLDRILKQKGGVARSLRIVGITRTQGATPGTTGDYLYWMGQSTHRTGKDMPLSDISAHEDIFKTRTDAKTRDLNPNRRVINTKLFGQDTPFDPKLDDFDIADELYEDFKGQLAITNKAYNRSAEVKTRKYFNKLLGEKGDVYNMKLSNPKRKLAQQLFETLPFGHDHVVQGLDQGLDLPELPKKYQEKIKALYKSGVVTKKDRDILKGFGKPRTGLKVITGGAVAGGLSLLPTVASAKTIRGAMEGENTWTEAGQSYGKEALIGAGMAKSFQGSMQLAQKVAQTSASKQLAKASTRTLLKLGGKQLVKSLGSKAAASVVGGYAAPIIFGGLLAKDVYDVTNILTGGALEAKQIRGRSGAKRAIEASKNEPVATAVWDSIADRSQRRLPTRIEEEEYNLL